MAKQELNWTNVQATSLSGDLLKAWDAMKKAQDTFKATVVAGAQKAKKLETGETLAINLKPWGFGMAKTKTRSAIAAGKDTFANL